MKFNQKQRVGVFIYWFVLPHNPSQKYLKYFWL